MTRAAGTDGFNEEMGWLPGYEGGEAAGDGFDTAFYAEAASAREYARRYGEGGQAQRERALKQLEGTGYEELVMQGLQAEQNSAYREKAAAFLESFMKGEYIPDVQLGELWQSAQAWQRQRTQAGSRQDTAVQTAGTNTAREGLNPVPGTAYNESTPNAAEGLTVGESLTEGNGYAAAGEMLGEWAEGAGEAEIGDNFGKIGTYTEKPNLNVDWKQYADHAINDSMIKRRITQEMVDSYVVNGKALAQGNGKYVFVSREGVAVVTSNGKLVTTWSSADFDANMLEIVNKLFGRKNKINFENEV